jgi:hypothetical protein
MSKAFLTGNAECVTKALKADPHNSMALMAVGAGASKSDPLTAALCAHEMIEHMDGDTLPWAIFGLYGDARLALGSVIEAKRSFQTGLQYLPYYRPCFEGVGKCDNILKSGGKVIIKYSEDQGEKPKDGLQNDPAKHSAVRPEPVADSNQAENQSAIPADPKD